MAGDWIKMRVGLWTHPKVVTLSSQLSVTRAHAIGALHCAWSIADQHADENGRIEMSSTALDSLCETPGLSSGMASVGWLIVSDSSLQFLNYQEHNGTTGKHRAEAQRRQRASRIRHTSVTQNCDKTVTRGDKRREEKKDPPNPPAGGIAVPIPAELDTAEFRAAWSDWLADRKARNKKVTQRSAEISFRKLVPLGPSRAVECIHTSIANTWTGLFPERLAATNGNHKPTVADLNAAMAQKYGSQAKAGEA